jgi:hypothetical protein
MPVNETATLERSLESDVGVEVDRIYCNGLYPDRFSEAEVQRLGEVAEGDADARLRAAHRAAVSEFRRAGAQRQQLERLESMTEAPVTTLPYVFAPELGPAEIGQLAELVA